jgi:hypothetical protein
VSKAARPSGDGRGGPTAVTASRPAVVEPLPIASWRRFRTRVRLQLVSLSHGSNKRRSSPMLQGALDTWLWLLFPTGAALVGFPFLGTAKAWRRSPKNRETISATTSLPAQVRKVRKVRKLEVQFPS